MSNMPRLLQSPGGLCALGIGALWILSWVVLWTWRSDLQFAGVALITWSHIALGALAVLISVAMVFRLERFERR